jgi:hypothetical protein
MLVDWPAKKITGTEDRHNSFFADLIDHAKPYAAFLKVHNILCEIALRENGFLSSKLAQPFFPDR